MNVRKDDIVYVWKFDSKPSTSVGPAPRSRCKHAACLCDSSVYIYGGKDGNVPLKDLWRFSLKTGTWEHLIWSGDKPPNLQGHTMVSYQNKIYIFGGSFQFGADVEIPFWVFDLDTMVCRKNLGTSPLPEGRRGHSAVVYKNCMYIFAGYIDLKHSSNELWAFNFDMDSWRLLIAVDGSIPSGRHSHSAVVNGHFMWVYGGLADLQAKDDLWLCDLSTGCWIRVKSVPGPPSLEGHSACTFSNTMLIFGGNHDGVPQNDLWAFDTAQTIWTKIVCQGNESFSLFKPAALLVSHNNWCFQHQSSSATSTFILQRAGSCPPTLKASYTDQLGVRWSSFQSHHFHKTCSSSSGDYCVEMEAQNNFATSPAYTLSERNSSTTHKFLAADLDSMCIKLDKKQNEVSLLKDCELCQSSCPEIVNPCHFALNKFQGFPEYCSGKNLADPICASCTVTGAKISLVETYQGQNGGCLGSEEDEIQRGSSDERCALAVTLLGTPTHLYNEIPSPSRKAHSQYLHVEPTEESLWVEMETFGHGCKACSPSSRDNLIIEDLDGCGVGSQENPSFELKQDNLEINSKLNGAQPLLCGSMTHDRDLNSRIIKEAWSSPAHHKAIKEAASANGGDTPVGSVKQNNCNLTHPDVHTSCQLKLFQADNSKTTRTCTCPDYCLFVFGGRLSSEAPNIEIRSMSVTKLEITLGNKW